MQSRLWSSADELGASILTIRGNSIVGEHHSNDPHLRLVVTVQQHKYASNTEHIYKLKE